MACLGIACYSSACACLAGSIFLQPVTVAAPSTTVTISPTLATSFITDAAIVTSYSSTTATTTSVSTVTLISFYRRATDSSAAGQYVRSYQMDDEDGLGFFNGVANALTFYLDLAAGYLSNGTMQIYFGADTGSGVIASSLILKLSDDPFFTMTVRSLGGMGGSDFTCSTLDLTGVYVWKGQIILGVLGDATLQQLGLQTLHLQAVATL
ncbi:hypothetical protein TWF694_004402 [Orbilia ellipsospora]|uniref:Uncharacterized protein n=1 Tax=Orbilia ellipsospora TaxID=2528407 RepID=A0AAV9WV11_9PEZI